MASGALRELAAHQLRVLGHPARLRLIELLSRANLTVTELAERAGLPADGVSKHLRELASVQLVAREQEGNFARYSLADSDVAKLVALAYRSVAREARRQHSIARHATGRPRPLGPR